MPVSHTLLVMETNPNALNNASLVDNTRSTNARKDPLLKPQPPLKSSPTSTRWAQWKLLSKSMKISSNTRVVSITTPQVPWLVATPSRSLVGELKMEFTTGPWPTLGVPHGENKDSSESNKVKSELMIQSMDAPQMLEAPSSDLLSNTDFKSIFKLLNPII